MAHVAKAWVGSLLSPCFSIWQTAWKQQVWQSSQMPVSISSLVRKRKNTSGTGSEVVAALDALPGAHIISTAGDPKVGFSLHLNEVFTSQDRSN